MRKRFTGAFIVIAIGAAVSLSVAAQQPPARQGGAAAPAQGRGAAAPAQGRGTATPRPDRIAGHPNLNGIYQAINTANWNLEDHEGDPGNLTLEFPGSEGSRFVFVSFDLFVPFVIKGDLGTCVSGLQAHSS